jgi:hypothetical protein
MVFLFGREIFLRSSDFCLFFKFKFKFYNIFHLKKNVKIAGLIGSQPLFFYTFYYFCLRTLVFKESCVIGVLPHSFYSLLSFGLKNCIHTMLRLSPHIIICRSKNSGKEKPKFLLYLIFIALHLLRRVSRYFHFLLIFDILYFISFLQKISKNILNFSLYIIWVYFDLSICNAGYH